MRTTFRTATRLLGIAALAVLLSGCLKATQELTLHEDDTVDGTVVFAVNKQFLDMAGVTADDFLKEITQGEGPVPGGVDFETAPYEDDEFIGSEFTFEGAPLSAFSDAGEGDISIVREGDTFVVSGTLDATSEDLDPSGTPGGQAILDSFDVRISVTFPGEVESAPGGEIDGNTVTWSPKLGESTEISARGSAVASGGGSGANLWILLGAALVLIVVVVIVLVLRKKPEPTAEPSQDATPADAGTAPPVAGQGVEVPAAPSTGEAPSTPPPPPVPVDEPVTEPVAEPTTEPTDTPDVAPDPGDAGDGGADTGSD